MRGAEYGTPPAGHLIKIGDLRVQCDCGWVMKTGVEGPAFINDLILRHMKAVSKEKRP